MLVCKFAGGTKATPFTKNVKPAATVYDNRQHNEFKNIFTSFHSH